MARAACSAVFAFANSFDVDTALWYASMLSWITGLILDCSSLLKSLAMVSSIPFCAASGMRSNISSMPVGPPSNMA